MSAGFYGWFFYAIAFEDLILGVACFIWWRPLLDLLGRYNPLQLSTRTCRPVTFSHKEWVTGW